MAICHYVILLSGDWPSSLEIHCSSFKVFSTVPRKVFTYSAYGTLYGLVALWNVLREGMLSGARECLFGDNCAYLHFCTFCSVEGHAKWCILSGSPAGIQNSHLKFYAAWLIVDSVRVDCRVMNVCVFVFWVLTPFSVVDVLRSVIRMSCLLADGDCSSITCLLPCQTTQCWNTRTSNTNASMILYFCVYIDFYRLFVCTKRWSLWASFPFILSTVWVRGSEHLALLLIFFFKFASFLSFNFYIVTFVRMTNVACTFPYINP